MSHGNLGNMRNLVIFKKKKKKTSHNTGCPCTIPRANITVA